MGEDTVGGVRWHGSPPYELAVVHGGPGAPGSAAGAARALSSRMGVVEPLQSAGSLDDQVDELAAQLRHADVPLGVLGHSWGAMLGYLVAARYPELVRVLVMVGAMLTAEAEDGARRNRLARLSEAERAELGQVRVRLDDRAAARRYDELVQQADAVAPIAVEHDWLAFDRDVKRAVWAEAVELRDDGRLLAEGRRVRCPVVVVVHGDQDPHPLAGVVAPLGGVIIGPGGRGVAAVWPHAVERAPRPGGVRGPRRPRLRATGEAPVCIAAAPDKANRGGRCGNARQLRGSTAAGLTRGTARVGRRDGPARRRAGG